MLELKHENKWNLKKETEGCVVEEELISACGSYRREVAVLHDTQCTAVALQRLGLPHVFAMSSVSCYAKPVQLIVLSG